MSPNRRIKKLFKSKPTIEGAGVHLKRAFGHEYTPQLDPFLLLDDFHAKDPIRYINGFPWHPHRGIETITYVLEGKVEHGDSMGNSGVIAPGDVQWMTAGSGIVHQEMPKGRADGLMWGFQLWANLPAVHKMMHPRYQGISAAQIPEVKLQGGIRVKVLCGTFANVKGPVEGVVIDPEYLDITLAAGTVFSHAVLRNRTVFCYSIDGGGYFEPQRDPYAYEIEGGNYFDFKRDCLIEPETAVLFDNNADSIRVTAGEKGVRFLLVSGNPIKEPVAWYGPIVMNTNEELRVAFEEYENGTFLKHEQR
ncbi:MAG TPA: pirin family protein [Chitinivibrionales bacterium]